MTIPFSLTCLCLTSLLTAYVFFSQKWRGWGKACVMGIGFFVVAIYTDYIFLLIIEGASGGVSRPFLRVLGLFVSKSIQAAALMMGRVLSAPGRETEEELADSETGRGIGKGKRREDFGYLDRLTIGIHLFFLILILFIPDAVTGHMGSLYRLFMLLFCLAVMLVYDTSLYFHGRKQRELARRSEDAARRHEADLYLKGVEDNYQRTRELWHDLKNHISLLNLLLQEKKYEQLGDYLRIFGEDVDSLTLPVKSGNLVVDALLADKLGRAKKENISVELSLCNLTGLRLRPNEICSLLGNLLDNALEANSQVEEGRFLEVDCREQEDCFYIRVRNAMAAQDREKDGSLQSGKSDRRNRVGHGLGLRSVERIVHGCGGEIAMDRGKACFTVVVRLPK